MKRIIERLKKICSPQKISLSDAVKTMIILAVGLVPLATLSFAPDYLQFDKTVIIYIITLLAAIFFLVDLHRSREVSISLSRFDGSLILFNIVYLIASIAGRNFFRSFWGSDLRLGMTYATLTSLMIIYALTRYYFRDWKSFKALLWVLAATPILAGIYMIAARYLNLPLASLLSDSAVSGNLILAVSAIISAILFITAKGKNQKIILGLMLAAAHILLFLADSSGALLFLLVFTLIFILISSAKQSSLPSKSLSALTIYALVLTLVIIFPIGVWLGQPTVIDLQLPWLFHWPIVKGVLFEKLLFGYGPQNFSEAFYAFKPAAFNLTAFWSLGFLQARSFLAEILTTTGLLGAISWYGFSVGLLIASWRSLRGSVLDELSPDRADLITKRLLWSLAAALILASLFSAFEVYQLLTIFILLAGVVNFIIKPKIKTISLSPLVAQIILYAGLLAAVIAGYYLLSAKASNYYLLSKSNGQIEAADLDRMLERVRKAERLNPGQANFFISEANVLAAKIQLRGKDDKSQAVPTADETKSILLAYENSGRLAVSYQDLLSLRDSMVSVSAIIGADGLQVAPVQEKMAAMDKLNPTYPLTEARELLGLLENSLADSGQSLNEESKQKINSLIVADLEKAIELKADLADAHYLLGRYWQLSGDKEKSGQYYLQALSLDLTNQTYIYGLLQNYLWAEKYDELLTLTDRYLRDNPEDLSLLQFKVEGMKKLNKDAEEIKQLEAKIEELKSAQNQAPTN